jgi:hypothetical protein
VQMGYVLSLYGTKELSGFSRATVETLQHGLDMETDRKLVVESSGLLKDEKTRLSYPGGDSVPVQWKLAYFRICLRLGDLCYCHRRAVVDGSSLSRVAPR